MIGHLERIAQSLEIPTPLPFREWVPGWGETENRLVGLLCRIAGTDQWSPLLQVHVPLTYAVKDAAVRLGMNGEDLEKLALQAFNFLAREYRRNNRTKWPSQSGSPRYAFLAAGHTSKGPLADPRLDPSLLPPMYRCISHDTLRGLIKLENQIVAATGGKSNIPHGCGWAARLLVRYAPDVSDTDLEQIQSQRFHAIDAFEARHREVSRKRGYDSGGKDEEEILGLRQRFVRRHLIALTVLLTGKINSKMRQRPQHSRAQRRWLYLSRRRLAEGGSSGSVSQISQPMSAWNLQDAASLGVAPGEFEQVLVEGVRQHERSGSMWAKLSRSALVYKYEEAVAWSRELPTLTDLARCYKEWFGRHWDAKDRTTQLAVFKAMLQLHHGLLPELLTTIRVATRRQQGRKLLQEDGIYLDKERLTITQLLPIQLEPEFLLAAKQWEDRGLVEIDLHPMLRTMLKGLLNHYPLPKSGERWIPPNSPATRVLPRGMTALKLCRCFESYYTQRHGLEPELASLVAGRPVLGRNASVHYFRTNDVRLRLDHWKAFEDFHDEIWQVARTQCFILRAPPSTTVEGPEKPVQPVGSLFYPNKVKLARYLGALRKRLEWLRRMGDHEGWREVLAIYVYECLRLVTGMRVIEAPQFTPLCLMGEGKWLRLQEKGPNPRVVPVHPVVADLIVTLAQANAWLHGRFKPRHPRYEGPLFFIERDGKSELLSSAVIKEVCRKQDIKHPGVRPNAHRHLMRSQIHDCGLSHQIADFVLGHTHHGPHVQDQLSLVPMEQLRRQFMPVADSLVEKLGIQTVRAWS